MHFVIYKFDEKITASINPKFIIYMAITTLFCGHSSKSVNFLHLFNSLSMS